MKWPWVSRLAYDMAMESAAAWREAHDRVVDAIIAVRRKEVGLPREVKRAEEPDREDFPPEVYAYLRSFSSPSMRMAAEEDIRASRRQGTPWPEIVRVLMEVEKDDAFQYDVTEDGNLRMMDVGDIQEKEVEVYREDLEGL